MACRHLPMQRRTRVMPRLSILRTSSDAIGKCGNKQVAALTIALHEAVADRALLDGTVWPNRDGHIVPPRLIFSGG